MAKVTSKLQVTIPKALADRFGIRPGDEIQFVEAGDGLRIILGDVADEDISDEERLRLFDEATARQRERDGRRPPPIAVPDDRGWTRDELYDRGRSR